MTACDYIGTAGERAKALAWSLHASGDSQERLINYLCNAWVNNWVWLTILSDSHPTSNDRL